MCLDSKNNKGISFKDKWVYYSNLKLLQLFDMPFILVSSSISFCIYMELRLPKRSTGAPNLYINILRE